MNMRRLLRALVGLGSAGALMGLPMIGSAQAVSRAKPSVAFSTPNWVAQVGQPGHAGIYAWGMATELNGDIVVSDYENRVVRILQTNGTVSQTLALPGHGGHNSEPYGMGVDPHDGTLYVLDVVAQQLDIFNGPAQGYTLRGTYSFATQPWLIQPAVYIARLAVDPAGNVWVENAYGVPGGQFPWPNRIYELAPDGQGNVAFTGNSFGTSDTTYPSPATMRGMTFGSGPCLADPSSLCQDLFIVEPGNGVVEVVDADAAAANPQTPDAGLIEKIGSSGPSSTPGTLSGDVRDVAVDGAHQLVYVTDPTYHRVNVYDLQGHVLTVFGTAGAGGSNFGGIRDITIGPDGNLYIADFANYTVDVWSPYVSPTQLPGYLGNIPNPSLPPPPGGLNKPQDVAVSPVDGTVYVADVYNQRVQEFAPLASEDPTCQCVAPVAQWGSRGSDSAPYGMNYPRGVAVDPATGHVWANNTRGGDIKIFAPNGTDTPPPVKAFGVAGLDPIQPYQATNDYFYSRGLAVSADGSSAYITDTGNTRIKKVQANGTHVGTVQAAVPCGTPNFTSRSVVNGCTGVAIGAGGVVYAVNPTSNTIYVFDANLNVIGTLTTAADNKAGDLNQPYGVAVDGSRNRLYVTEGKGNRVDTFDISNATAPAWVGSWGTTGAANGQFSQPQGISLDRSGNIYVDDLLNERVQVFAP